MARHRLRRWVPYGGGWVLVMVIIAGLWPRPVLVETARAQLGPLRTEVVEEGRTQVRERFVVAAPVGGQLQRIQLEAGDPVMATQTVVAVIDPVRPALLDARSRLLALARRDGSVASLERARAAQQFALSERQRFERLFADKTIPIQELEAAQWRAEAATREVASAESAVRQAEAELAPFVDADEGLARDPVTVTAPAGGRVLRILQESSRVVSAGTPLLEIGDPSNLEVVVDVLSRDAAAIEPGTPVELEQWGGTSPLLAKVRRVEPAAFTKVSALGVEEQRVNLIADLVTPPEDRRNLGDQYRVEARIIVWSTNRTLKVPSGALFRFGQDWAAYQVQNRRANLRRVVTGRSGEFETEVREGLAEGDIVVLYPGDRVRDGRRVESLRIDGAHGAAGGRASGQ